MALTTGVDELLRFGVIIGCSVAFNVFYLAL